MRPFRYFLMGLVALWSLSHAAVLGDQVASSRGGAAADRIRKALEQPIVLDFIGPSLHAALEHIADKAGMPFSIDQVALAQLGIAADEENVRFLVKAKEEKVALVLRRLLAGYRLTYIVLDDTLLITSDEGAIRRLMQQHVDVDHSGVPLAQAARDIGRRHGVNIVIDPRVAKLAQTPVTLQLEGAGLETAVRVMAELAELKAVRLSNVLFITTEERAARIRKEETNTDGGVALVPGGLGPPLVGGVGGAPIRVVPAPAEAKDPPPPPQR